MSTHWGGGTDPVRHPPRKYAPTVEEGVEDKWRSDGGHGPRGVVMEAAVYELSATVDTVLHVIGKTFLKSEYSRPNCSFHVTILLGL